MGGSEDVFMCLSLRGYRYADLLILILVDFGKLLPKRTFLNLFILPLKDHADPRLPQKNPENFKGSKKDLKPAKVYLYNSGPINTQSLQIETIQLCSISGYYLTHE